MSEFKKLEKRMRDKIGMGMVIPGVYGTAA